MPVSTLDDRAAIRDVLVNYALGLDRRDYDLVARCFATDAECEYEGETLHGVAELLPYLRERLDLLAATHHYISNETITVTGDTAIAECYALAVLLRDTGTGVEALQRGLRYADELRRDGDRWVIITRRHLPQWMITSPADRLDIGRNAQP